MNYSHTHTHPNKMSYIQALSEAIDLANLTNRDAGIEKIGKSFAVRLLPNPENRTGFELRCEIIRPGTPHSIETAAHAAR